MIVTEIIGSALLVAGATLSFLAGVGSGLANPSQQAAVADVVGSKARGGPVLAAFQMAADIGAVIGPIASRVPGSSDATLESP